MICTKCYSYFKPNKNVVNEGSVCEDCIEGTPSETYSDSSEDVQCDIDSVINPTGKTQVNYFE